MIAFDDSPHKKEDLRHNNPNKEAIAKVDLIGVVFRGLQLLHVTQDEIEVDGKNSTEKIIENVVNNPFYNELRMILIDSPTLAGFNVVDPFEIHEKTKLPVILLPDDKPKDKIINVYEKVFPERIEQIQWLNKLPDLDEIEVNIKTNSNISKHIYFHSIGTTREEIQGLIEYLCEFSSRPEPLRIAHLIASRDKK